MSTRTTTIITIATLLLILALGVWYIIYIQQGETTTNLQESSAGQALGVNQAASSTPFSDMSGSEVDLTQFLGQVLVVNSWASWSPYSATELSRLAQVVSTYDGQDVVILAVNRAEPRHLAEVYLKTIEVDDKVQLIVDVDDRYYKAIGGYAMPETVFYDRNGEMVAHHNRNFLLY